MHRRVRLASLLFLAAAIASGCGNQGLAPAYTPEQIAEMARKEKAPELEALKKVEQQYGSEHPYVKQRRMELEGKDHP
jgi:hypothetical protein